MNQNMNEFDDESVDEGFNEDLSGSNTSSSGLTTDQISQKVVIKGPNGSIRGKRNSVRNSVQNYKELIKLANESKADSKRNYEKEEQNLCVLYVTTIGIIRETFENCKKLKAILFQHLIRFDERDIYINNSFKEELRERMSGSIVVPQLFLNGKQFGSLEVIERLNECGQLLNVLSEFRLKQPEESGGASCGCCGGSKFIPCQLCFGSRKTLTKHFISDSISLKCSHCRASNGLIKCPKCYQ